MKTKIEMVLIKKVYKKLIIDLDEAYSYEEISPKDQHLCVQSMLDNPDHVFEQFRGEEIEELVEIEDWELKKC